MARGRKKERSKSASKQVKHPLLVYHNLGRRYRPPALLLIVMGIFALLPHWIEELQISDFDPEALAKVGGVLILAGVGFWLFATIALRRSYVMCRSDLLVVRSPFYRTLVSYRRIKEIQAIPVKKLYEDRKLKGMGKPLMEPLLGGMAVAVTMKTWPRSKRRLKWFHSPFLFSPRKGEEAWVFVVPNYSILMREIQEYQTRKLDEERRQQYEDPIARLKYYSR